MRAHNSDSDGVTFRDLDRGTEPVDRHSELSLSAWSVHAWQLDMTVTCHAPGEHTCSAMHTSWTLITPNKREEREEIFPNVCV